MTIILVIIERIIDNKCSSNDIEQQEEDEINFQMFRNLSYIFWLLCIVCTVYYSSFLPFNVIASPFLIQNFFKDMKKVDAQNLAGTYMAIPFFLSAVLVPINGLFIDKYGKRVNFLTFSGILGIVGFSCFFFSAPLLGFVVLGLAYSVLAATIWPCFSIITNTKTVGLAFGVCTSLQNLGLSIAPIIIAYIVSVNKNYFSVSIIY